MLARQRKDDYVAEQTDFHYNIKLYAYWTQSYNLKIQNTNIEQERFLTQNINQVLSIEKRSWLNNRSAKIFLKALTILPQWKQIRSTQCQYSIKLKQ